MDLDATLPSEMPGPLMASSPVRLRAEMADLSGIAVVSTEAVGDAASDACAPDASDAPDVEVSVATPIDVVPTDVTQPTSTTAEVQAENGKS